MTQRRIPQSYQPLLITGLGLLAGLFAVTCSGETFVEPDAGTQSGSQLLAFYALNGNTLDASGGEAHATFYLEAYGDDRDEVAERAAYLFGGFTEVTIGNVTTRSYPLVIAPSMPLGDRFTMAAWVLHYNPRGEPGRIVGEGNGFSIYFDGETDPDTSQVFGHLSFGQLDERTPTGPTAQDSNVFPDSRWHFVAGVLDNDGTSSTLTLYLDGEVVDTVTVADTLFDSPNDCRFYAGPGLAHIRSDPIDNTGAPFNAGGECAIDYSLASFPGAIDDVRVYDRALDADEIRAIFEGN